MKLLTISNFSLCHNVLNFIKKLFFLFLYFLHNVCEVVCCKFVVSGKGLIFTIDHGYMKRFNYTIQILGILIDKLIFGLVLSPSNLTMKMTGEYMKLYVNDLSVSLFVYVSQ